MSYYHWLNDVAISTQNGANFRFKRTYGGKVSHVLEVMVEIEEEIEWKEVAHITSFDAKQLVEFFSFLQTSLEYTEGDLI